jgi:hypothetical protein
MFSSNQMSSEDIKTKNKTDASDPEPQVLQPMRRPNTPNAELQVTSSMRRPITPNPESRVIQSLRRPSTARSSLIQAFRQILAQQNDAEYITLSSGDEDDNY